MADFFKSETLISCLANGSFSQINMLQAICPNTVFCCRNVKCGGDLHMSVCTREYRVPFLSIKQRLYLLVQHISYIKLDLSHLMQMALAYAYLTFDPCVQNTVMILSS